MSFPVLSPEDVRRVLAGLPRLTLAHLPTPLDEAPRFAERIGSALGDSAMNVIIRLSSFILVCIGVQILWNGLSALLRTVIH